MRDHERIEFLERMASLVIAGEAHILEWRMDVGRDEVHSTFTIVCPDASAIGRGRYIDDLALTERAALFWTERLAALRAAEASVDDLAAKGRTKSQSGPVGPGSLP